MNGSSAAILAQNSVLGGGAPVAFHNFVWPSSSSIIASSICLASCLALWRRSTSGSPSPRCRPRRTAWAVGTEREARGGHLAGDLRLGRIVERAPPQRVGDRERGIAGHEHGVGLVAVIGRHAARRDLVGVDRVPPVLDRLLHARLGQARLPAGCRELLVVALIGRQQHVAIVAPHRPEPAEPAVVHRHAADIAELDLVVRLQLLAHGRRARPASSALPPA